MERLDDTQMSTISGREGITFSTFLEIGPANGSPLAFELQDEDGDNDLGSPTAGAFRVEIDGSDSLILRGDFISNSLAQFGLNFDSDEGMVLDVREAQLNLDVTRAYVGDATGTPIGAFGINDMNLDGSFLKVRIQ